MICRYLIFSVFYCILYTDIKGVDMDFAAFFHSPFFIWFMIPFLIFISRIMDMTLDTMRIIFVSKGYKLLAAVCGFFQVLR